MKFMEDLIELYLFKHKMCPLPDIGTLKLFETNAVASLAERKIHAPVHAIRLVDTVMPATDFINFISANKKISFEAAKEMLMKYCGQLQRMDAYRETKLPHAGKFYVDADGNLIFKAIEVPKIFLPDVNAERIIHPDASHNIRVGDKERTSTEMTAYYSDTALISKDKWWIWAILLFVIAIAAILVYISDGNSHTTFGNQQQEKPANSTSTYKVAK